MRISDWSSDVCSSDLGGDAVADLDRHGFDDAASRLPQFLDMADHLAARVGDRHARFDREHARAVCRAGSCGGKLTETALEAAREIGRAHVCTPVTNAHLVCRLLLAKKNTQQTNPDHTTQHQ